MGPDELDDLLDDGVPADERAQLLREVPLEAVDPAEHRELRRQSFVDDLVDGHPAAQTAEPVLAH